MANRNGSRACSALWRRARGLTATIRSRLRGREDTEHEQVLVRLVIAIMAFVYLAVMSTGESEAALLAARCLPLAIGYLLGSAALVAHLIWSPAPRPARRCAGLGLDILTLTFALVIGEATAAIFYPFYLWITFGMGFRYGRAYLYASAAMSLASFALVIALTEYWHAQPALSAGLWVALFVLPLYASSLLAKLTDALSRAEAASRAKTRFLATISHELRTPLNAIIGMADLLRGTRLSDEQKDMARTVRSAAQTLLEMINDVLDVAKIESGRMAAEPVEFDLHRLIATLRALLHHQAAAKGLALGFAVDPAIPHRLSGAARFLQQILTNLIANAIKFTDQGGVTVRFLALAVGSERVTVRFVVEDTGIGIAADAQERIFDQFTQADESTTRRYGGTGLGLAIARQLTALMDGSLEVESAPGKGAKFTFEASFACEVLPPRRLQGRVVVLGDRSLAKFWCAQIESWGASCRVAGDSAEAKRMLARTRGERALLVLDGQDERTLARLPGALAERFPTEPTSAVLVTENAAEADGYLALVPPDAGDEIRFSALHASLARSEAPAGDQPLPEPVSEPRHILVAEDNRTNQKVIAKILQRGGHVVTLVGNGEEALDALERQTFDLVLMDLNMPVMGGLDAVKMHQFMTGGRNGTAFVALTADVTEEARRDCAAAGIREFVTKPVDAAQLLALVQRLTGAAPSQRRGVEARPGGVVVPHPRLTSASPALDKSYMDRLRQLDDDDGFVAEVIRDFLLDAAQLVDELAAAALAGDAVRFRDRAHALRSSAAHIGATAIFELCLGWRGMAPPELAQEGARHVARLRAEFERLEAALAAALDQSDPNDRPAFGQPT